MISGTRYRLTLEINRQSTLAREMERAQTEISSEKRILSPSDDPVGAARVSDIARAQANESRFKLNLEQAFAISARADTALASVATGFTRAIELMTSAANGTLTAENRATIALELRSIADEINSLKQSRDARGEALFPAGAALQIPVGEGMTLAAVGTSDAVFNAQTAAGPQDLAAIITAAAAAIEEPDDTLRAAAIGVSLDAIAAGDNHLASARGDQGSRGARIDTLLEGLEVSKMQLADERTATEGVDITAVIARLQAKKLTLDAAQAVFSRINQSTLFDLLR